jgi:hypothetical protein
MAAHVSEERRLREVRKYYVASDTLPTVGEHLAPPVPNLSATVSSPDQTLTALMQLIACRLGMQRAMVSVVEQHAQVSATVSGDAGFIWKLTQGSIFLQRRRDL